MNLAAAIRMALIGDVAITGLISLYKGVPSIHTKRPLPADVSYPTIAISPDIVFTDRDYVNSEHNFIVRDIIVYGQNIEKQTNADRDYYRDVENVSLLVRKKFHRQRFSIAMTGYRVISVVAIGPTPAPTDDDKLVARRVSLSLTIQPTS